MPQAQVNMTVRFAADNISFVDISGEMTGFAENALMDAYTQATSKGASIIALNFTDLDYMNSSGIGLLVTLLIRAQRQTPPQNLIAFGLTEHYRQIFELTRLNDAINIYETEQDVLNGVGV